MKLQQAFSNSLLLLVSPWVTILSVAVAPSVAATLSVSQAEFTILNYNQTPEGLSDFGDNSEASAEQGTTESANSILTSAQARTSVKGRTAFSQAQAEAFFLKSPPFSSNTTFSQASGTGNTYFGLAQSQAKVAGEFSIKAGETFSFDFIASLNLLTEVENPFGEIATASGNLSLALLDSSTNTVLDFFTVISNIVTSAYAQPLEDFFVSDKSNNINFTFRSEQTAFGNNNQESVAAFFTGSYQRYFDSDTNLILIETKTSQVTVQAPEPSSTFGLLLGFGLTGAFLGAKSKRNRQSKLFSTQIDKV